MVLLCVLCSPIALCHLILSILHDASPSICPPQPPPGHRLQLHERPLPVRVGHELELSQRILEDLTSFSRYMFGIAVELAQRKVLGPDVDIYYMTDKLSASRASSRWMGSQRLSVIQYPQRTRRIHTWSQVSRPGRVQRSSIRPLPYHEQC